MTQGWPALIFGSFCGDRRSGFVHVFGLFQLFGSTWMALALVFVKSFANVVRRCLIICDHAPGWTYPATVRACPAGKSLLIAPYKLSVFCHGPIIAQVTWQRRGA